jgi:chromosome segregation protein
LKEIDVEVGDVKPIIEKESIAFLKEKDREIEEKMERMQPVNMRAMEEYDRQRGRKKKFDEEIDRLRNQRSELMNLVEQIEKKKKRIFNEAFDSINENFCQIYKNLSNGSEAKLGLENESNPFEGGLIIEVKPKGERGMRLEALSGGEKSLASLAFIFAIQEYQPSPFYVLDEVDMFLDGLNAEKIAKIIKENSRMAQFIMISLKKIALREADHVYGVTIEEGVSNIIGKVNV